MFYNKFVLADGTVLYDNIVSVSWTEQVNSDSDNITPGAVCANAIDIEFWITSDGSLAIAQGSTLTYYKVDADTGTEYQIGIYTCEKPEKDGGNKYKVTAYDNIAKLDIDVADWLNSLNFPITIEAFANSLAAKCGLTFKNVPPINGDYPVQAFTANSSTGRDLMKMVAQATGCFIRAASNGELEYAWYVTNSELLIATNKAKSLRFHKTACDKENKILRDRQIVKLRTADVVYQPESTPYFSGQLTFSDFTVTAIDKVQVKQSDDDVGVIYPADSMGTNALVISGNKLLVTDSDATLRPYVKNLYDRLNNMVYVPCSNIQTPETLDIRAGDIVTVTDGKQKFVTWITSIKRSGNRCTFESVGSINRNTTTTVNNAKYNSKQKILEISATVDGLTVKAEQTTKDISGLSTQYTQLEQTFNKFELTAVTDGNVRSKFALDQTSVTIESGTITFKGGTLVVDSDNFKLKQDGTVSITGTLTSQTTYGKAIVGDGEITLSQKVASGEWSPAVRIYSDGVGGSYLLGHITVYGDQGSSDKRVDIYTDQGGAKMAMRNASGKTFMMFESDGSGEGHLSIGGENGLGYLECKRLRIDGHNVALSRVNYTNQEGTPTWEYLLTAHQGNAW